MNSDSTSWSLRDLSGPRVRVQDVCRVPSGSPVIVHLTAEVHGVNGPGAALVLAKRHLGMRSAHAVVTKLFDSGAAVVALPAVESMDALKDELAAAFVSVTRYGPPASVDVQAIRRGLGLSQEEFALEFGLDVATVRNWEQGRSGPDKASRALLSTIMRNPDAVRGALVEAD